MGENGRTLSKAYGINVWCYWEHLENTLGTLGIWWEHIENNTKVTNPSPSAPDPRKEKNLRASRVHYWLSRIFIPSLVCHHFQLRLMEWKGHMSAYWGIHLKVWWNNINFAQKIPNEKDWSLYSFLKYWNDPYLVYNLDACRSSTIFKVFIPTCHLTKSCMNL